MTDSATTAPGTPDGGETRRDFLLIATSTVGVVGAAIAALPLVHSMNPSADVLAEASTEVDLGPIEEGQSITAVWRGKPVFIRHRTEAEIKRAQDVAMEDLPDPQLDSDRAQRSEWLVMVGICTHLGCIPQGQSAGDPRGDFDGWFCPCHGSHYDSSGRIRKGPAPRNLVVPPYSFIDDTTIEIG